MVYLIKVNIILALLCLLFQVVMHRDTFFGVRRAMLWGIYLTALLLPLWDMHLWMQNQALTMHVASDYATYILPTLNITASRVAAMGIDQKEPGCGMWFVGVMMLWVLIYLIPVVWMTLKLLWQVVYIIYLRFTCVREVGSYFRYPRPCSPFSFGTWIFLHPDGMDEQTFHEVLTHEQAHVRGWHTIDILFSQLFCILFWWNPAVWVLRREIRLNIEFIADKAVADSLTPVDHEGAIKAYQYRLLGFTTQMNVATIANNFNVLPLKRRIIMMNLKRTRRMGMAKYILFVPAAAALLLVSNVDALARTLEEKVKEPLLVVNGQVVEHSGAILSQVDIDHVSVLREESARTAYGENAKNGAIVIATKDGGDPIFEKVEKLPQYPGGEQALYNFLAMNCRYPAEAHDWGVQGRVLVSFVVEKDGALSDISTAKVVDLNTGQQMSEMVVIAKKDMTPEEAEAAKLQAEHQAEGLKALKAEAERVVKALPERWQPGEQDGQIVRVRFTLPITFKLR